MAIARPMTGLLEDGPIERQFAEDFNQRSGLTFVVKAGIFVSGITVNNIAETSLTMTDAATNTVYLDVGDNTIKSSTSAPSSGIITMFEVVTVAGAITTVTDNRKVITTAILSL